VVVAAGALPIVIGFSLPGTRFTVPTDAYALMLIVLVYGLPPLIISAFFWWRNHRLLAWADEQAPGTTQAAPAP
jgi:beta-lactamase regulating signal transducer with metallopeptidase domain